MQCEPIVTTVTNNIHNFQFLGQSNFTLDAHHATNGCQKFTAHFVHNVRTVAFQYILRVISEIQYWSILSHIKNLVLLIRVLEYDLDTNMVDDDSEILTPKQK